MSGKELIRLLSSVAVRSTSTKLRDMPGRKVGLTKYLNHHTIEVQLMVKTIEVEVEAVVPITGIREDMTPEITIEVVVKVMVVVVAATVKGIMSHQILVLYSLNSNLV